MDMSKKAIELTFLALSILIGSTGHAETAQQAALQTGMTLDCARRYYSVESIKSVIDVISEEGGTFLQLHLTDNENVGVECAYLGQTAEDAELLADGTYRNPDTGKRFLSAGQMEEILAYASSKDVELVPEIDAPSHVEGFLVLAEEKFGAEYADRVASYRDDTECWSELDISSPEAVDLVKALYDEYAQMFAGCTYFHIGCDEFFSGDDAQDRVSYINGIAAYMEAKGFRVRMWNDLVWKDTLDDVSKSIEITYWSYDGDTEDASAIAERRAVRASAQELCNAGFSILNYNSYYLYYVPSVKNFNEHDNDYMLWDLSEHWNLATWDSNSGRTLSDTSRVIGSSVCLWSEDSGNLLEEDVIDQFIRHYRAMHQVVCGSASGISSEGQ